jgi:hypothetical protein
MGVPLQADRPAGAGMSDFHDRTGLRRISVPRPMQCERLSLSFNSYLRSTNSSVTLPSTAAHGSSESGFVRRVSERGLSPTLTQCHKLQTV